MKAAVIAFACAGIGLADLVCIDAWLLPAVVGSRSHAPAPAGMAAAGLFAIPSASDETSAPDSLAREVPVAPDVALPSAAPRPVATATPVVAAIPEAEPEPVVIAEAAPVPDVAPQTPVAAAPERRSIYFARTGAAEVDDAGRAELGALAERLKSDRTLAVSVHGHADARGSKRANHRLSKRRAQAVARLLREEGVAARRLELGWYGERAPAVTGTGDSAWAANRRVELRVHRSE